jgi:hypothetical protein
MSKLRESSTSSAPPAPIPLPLPIPSSSTNASLPVSSSQTRCAPSNVSLSTNSSATKSMTKSRSTHNLILPATIMPNSTTQQSKISTTYRIKNPRIPRRPPHLPAATNIQSSSSSSSSNTSSPIKTKSHLPLSLQESVLPLHELDKSPNDLMPKWAQDCFYRTVVLGLKPLLLQDIPSSPIKHSTSISSIESSDSIETTNELLNNQKEIKIQRSISIPDYKQIEIKKNKEKYKKT